VNINTKTQTNSIGIVIFFEYFVSPELVYFPGKPNLGCPSGKWKLQ
jgi:hypothetical protein